MFGFGLAGRLLRVFDRTDHQWAALDIIVDLVVTPEPVSAAEGTQQVPAGGRAHA